MISNTVKNVRRPLTAIIVLVAFVYLVLHLARTSNSATEETALGSASAVSESTLMADNKPILEAFWQDVFIRQDSESWQLWLDIAALPQPTIEFPSFQDFDYDED